MLTPTPSRAICECSPSISSGTHSDGIRNRHSRPTAQSAACSGPPDASARATSFRTSPACSAKRCRG
eukprot:6322010-Pyramimonas_sp.AAC.1